MRTTITIDADNAAAIRKLIEEKGSGRHLRRVVNDLLRLGIGAMGRQENEAVFRVKPLSVRFQPSVDVRTLGRIASEIEAEHEVERLLKVRDGDSGS